MLVLAQRQGEEHVVWDTREWDAEAQAYYSDPRTTCSSLFVLED